MFGLSFGSTCRACGFQNEGSEKFCGGCGRSLTSAASTAKPKFQSPQADTPKHLAEKIVASRSALDGERKQVTVLFADLKGSMKLLAFGNHHEVFGPAHSLAAIDPRATVAQAACLLSLVIHVPARRATIGAAFSMA